MQAKSLLLTQKSESELEKTINYISSNVVKAREGRKCVDGRYLPTQGGGMIARPGGDCGYVMALLGVNKRKSLGLSPEQCFNSIYKVVSQKVNGHFCMHTDHHVDPDSITHKGLIGCGHVAKAAIRSLSDEYDVNGEDVEKFIAYARNVADIMPTMEMINLEGEHNESGVLVIHSGDYTVNAEDQKLGRMYFVYDEARDTAFLKYLVEEMAIVGVNFAEMKTESDLQLAATLHNLAKGLPVYNVTFAGKKPHVEFDSFVK